MLFLAFRFRIFTREWDGMLDRGLTNPSCRGTATTTTRTPRPRTLRGMFTVLRAMKSSPSATIPRMMMAIEFLPFLAMAYIRLWFLFPLAGLPEVVRLPMWFLEFVEFS